MKIISLYLFALPLLVIYLSGCYSKQPVKTGLEGKPLPTFSLLMTDSTTYFNTANISAGKPTVLYYFSPRCPYCKAQMVEIIEDIEMLKDIRFYIFTSLPVSELKQFCNLYQLSKYSNIIAGVDYKHFFADYFETKSVPFLAVYGKDNKLKEAFLGKTYSKEIIKAVVSL